MSPTRNDRGFSMVMALVAIAILGAISMAIMSFSSSLNSQSRHVNSVAGARALISTIQGFTAYEALCTANLDPSTGLFNATQAATPAGIPLSYQLGAGPTGPMVQAGSKLIDYDVVVDYLIFRNAAIVGADPSVAGNKLYSGELALKLKKGGGAAGGDDLHERGLGSLVLSVNPTSWAITNCYALTDAQQACTQLGGTYSNAGVPKCQLPAPCAGIPNSMFLGYNANGTAQCETMSQVVGSMCAAGQYLVSDGNGGTTCAGP